jgi:hypothetical protein
MSDMTNTEASTTEETAGETQNANQTFSQQELDKIVADRVARERSKVGDYEHLKAKAQKFDELEQAKLSETEKLTGERDTFKTQAETAALDNLKLRVALAKQLPVELVDRLQGKTQEELEADAEGLLKLLTPNATGAATTTGLDGGARQSAAEKPSMNDTLRQMAGFNTVQAR